MIAKEEIKKILLVAAKSLGAQDVDFLVELPKEKSHGDYASNIAFAAAKLLHKNPNEVALLLQKEIEKNSFFKRVEVVGGFINFFLNDQIFAGEIKNILKNAKVGANADLKNKKIVVEHTDPNPFKVFHIGHLMNNAIGQSISRIFEFSGAKVKRAVYQGDVGLHVAKAIWGTMKMKDNHTFGSDKVKDLALGYAFGSEMYPNPEAKQEIDQINKKIYERSDLQINKLYDEGKKVSLQYFETIYKKIGTKFDLYFLESQVADFGKKTVRDALKKGIFEVGEKGAIVFKGEKFGLHTRVFINSEGLPTYEAKELGLAKIKYGKYKYDVSVIVTGNEVNEYFKVLKVAMSQVFGNLAEKTKHIGHGMLRLPEGKMSSRTGNVIEAESLIEQLKQKIQEKTAKKNLDDATLEKIAIGAIKYSILKQSIGSDIIYDIEKSITFEGDSGPYVQYSYVRALSVLKKAAAERVQPSVKKPLAQVGSLEKLMMEFEGAVKKAGKEYQPHYIATYLTQLAHEFNNYYAQNKIVDREDEFSPYKIAVTEAFIVIMENGLWLLGIEVVEKM